MDDSSRTPSGTADLATEPNELQVLTKILALLQVLDREAQERIFRSAATFLGLNLARPFPDSRHSLSSAVEIPQQVITSSFSEDRTISPKQFMLEKQPKTDVERVACLAYYLTHYRHTPYFKTIDISKLNTEAAQIKFSNPAFAVDNATKRSYLVPATKGNKQLSALGEQFVQALPDRDKAKAIMEHARPRRKQRRFDLQEEQD